MKIAYLCADNGIPVLGDKGSSVHVREFSNALVDLGHQVHIFATKATPANTPKLNSNTTRASLTILAPSEPTRNAARLMTDGMARFDEPNKHKHLYSEVLQILTDPEFTNAVLPMLQDWGPDLIIARHTLFSAAGMTLARSLNCSLVLEVNAPLVEERLRYWDLALQPEAEQSERAILPNADLLVAVSEGVRDYLLRNGVSHDRIVVLPNGINLSLFNPEVDGTVIRKRYGIEHKLVIGFSGSLKPWHGVDRLLQAFASLLQDTARYSSASDPAGLHLLIVGDGPQRKPLEQLCRELEVIDAVTFTGAVAHDDVPSFLAAMDIAVAPYLASDGFYFSPLKLMEYLAMGRAVVAPRLGQIPSLLQGAGELCGLLYSPDDQQELVSVLQRLSREAGLRHKLGASAVEQAHRHTSWQAIAHQITEHAASDHPAVPLEVGAI